MKWQLFEVDEEYVESYGREKTILTFYPVESYYSNHRSSWNERQVEFNSPEEAEEYITTNKEYFRQKSVYYCIPKVEIK